MRADRLGHLGEQRRPAGRRPRSRPSRPWSAATARSVSANATSGWNAPIWVPAAIAGASTSAPSAPLVWTIAWPPYIRTQAASGRDGVVGDGDDDELDLLDERLGSANARAPSTQRPEALAPLRVAAGDGVDRPARAAQRDAQRRPDGARPDDPGDRRLARVRRAGGDARGRAAWTSSPWRCVPGRHRVEVDPGRLDAPPRVSARSARGSSPGSGPARLHAASPARSAASAASSAVRLPPIECSDASEDRTRCHGIDPFGARAPPRTGPPRPTTGWTPWPAGSTSPRRRSR